MTSQRSAYLRAIENDDSLPIEPAAMALWIADLNNPFRWSLRPLCQFVFAILLHIIWFVKRLPLPQFSAHTTLQKIICWFCKNFVSEEANLLILRHYATESNLLNFIIDNQYKEVTPLNLYPKNIDEMNSHSFVDHDQELFRAFSELGAKDPPKTHIDWSHWQPIDMSEFTLEKKKTQVFDFETSHALFMCLFCLLLTREEYRDAINGFNLDQSMAIRIGEVVGDGSLVELAYNKYPHYLVGPWNLSQRFLMHGFFTEHVYAYLENLRLQGE